MEETQAEAIARINAEHEAHMKAQVKRIQFEAGLKALVEAIALEARLHGGVEDDWVTVNDSDWR
jgi:hypothetical protein